MTMRSANSDGISQLIRVNPSELPWLFLWSGLILALSTLPYLVCWGLQTEEYRFGGLVYDVGDIYTYLAEMQQGADGSWLLHLPFTSENHTRALVHPLYLLLGKLGRLFALQPIIAFHLARLGAGLVLLLAIYAFFAHFTASRPLRRLAFLLTGISSGMGWLVLIFGGDSWLGDIPIDFWVPEAYTLPVIYGFPHISLSIALVLFALITYLQSTETNRGWAIIAGIATLLLVFLVPFDIAIVWSAIGAYTIALWIKRRTFPRDACLAGLIVGLLSLPGLIYNYWVFAYIPAFAEWSRQNVGYSPHPLHFAASLAYLALLALVGMWRALRQPAVRWLLLCSWTVVGMVLVYLPFNLQRRLIAGLHPTLCLLATVGLVTVIIPAALRWPPLRRALRRSRRYSRHGVRQLILYSACLFTLPSNLLLLSGPVAQARQHREPIYQHRDKIAAVDWLGQHTAISDIVLSSSEEGNYIPAKSGNWVYIGHGAITGDYIDKLDEVQAFFGNQWPAPTMQEFLREHDISYVYFGPLEQALGPLDIEKHAFLTPIYSNDTVQILRVRP